MTQLRLAYSRTRALPTTQNSAQRFSELPKPSPMRSSVSPLQVKLALLQQQQPDLVEFVEAVVDELLKGA